MFRDGGARGMDQHQVHVVELQLFQAQVDRDGGGRRALPVLSVEAAGHPVGGPVALRWVKANFRSHPQFLAGAVAGRDGLLDRGAHGLLVVVKQRRVNVSDPRLDGGAHRRDADFVVKGRRAEPHRGNLAPLARAGREPLARLISRRRAESIRDLS